MKVAVLKGGSSLERAVSLKSGARVEDALNKLGHEVVAIDVGSDLVDKLRQYGPAAAFIALHGHGGEDGTVQELLEMLSVPYTGSGPAAAIRCMDKVQSKYIMQERGIPTADFFAFNETAFQDLGAAGALPEVGRQLGFPVVVKPATQGSALGVKFAAKAEEVPSALVAAFSYDSKVLIERYVEGREIAIGVGEGKDGPEPLPIVEVRPHSGSFFDFEARYEVGKTDYLCPAELEPGITEELGKLAVNAYEAMGCYGFARVDLILDQSDSPQILEINVIPGMTETSLLPLAAEAAGIEFEGLVEWMLKLALKR